jgi:hypothetical protein
LGTNDEIDVFVKLHSRMFPEGSGRTSRSLFYYTPWRRLVSSLVSWRLV